MVSAKRKRPNDELEDTPIRRLRSRADEDSPVEEEEVVHTPSRHGRLPKSLDNGTPRSILKKSGLNHVNGTTPKSNRKLLFATTTKSIPDESPTGSPNGTPVIVRNADRSARRKSNRRLIERTINGEDDDEAFDEEEALAEQILSDQEEEAQEEVAGTDVEAVEPETPSKRGRGRPKKSETGAETPKKRGRPRKQREPTPPQDLELPSHEEYFWQNRPGGAKTSDNTLPPNSLLNHDEYFQAMQSIEDRHQGDMDFLLDLHSRALDQWMFELEEGFNICLYGYGSKRPITERFADHIYHYLKAQPPYKGSKKEPQVVVINGYSPGTTLKEIFTTVASTVVPSHTKLPNQPSVLLNFLLDHLTANPPPHPIPVIINSIDSSYLRKAPAPSMLATLAAHPSINLFCTADTPNFPLLWDVGLKAQYKFLFHNATTFAPYTAEIDVVESVNELLGRSGRRIGGRDGVGFVLRTLPENARSLYRILVTEQLAQAYMDEGVDDEHDKHPATPKKGKKTVSSEATQGVEYRVLYHKAREEIICTSEVAFRTLLKEFYDHQMIESSKDAMGTEWLCVPFRREELEGLAEDLSGDTL
ncbi:ORC2-domain-containing protein [Sporormia fimetaria CBS 119925]|uniref:Origin recognition complex subunit 2 n=1 Tax=Sporormia fimetaria CBS 119925 TaxID=1340428 RepID=A0A6A6VLM8_9PLEO|nr:ORC2-domain-containing protein [Sporormia fimetaria CBS 119925]